MSVRVRLTIGFAAAAILGGLAMTVVANLFILRYVPESIPAEAGWAPNRGDLIRAFTPRMWQMFAVLVVLSIVCGWLLAGRMLRPLDRITAATRAVAAGDLGHRIQAAGRGDELTGLADSFDDMTARVEAHVGEQQRFAANASHELRTPLAVTATLLEVGRADPDADVPALLDRLAEVNTRAAAMVESLLVLARTRGQVEMTAVDLALVVEEAAEAASTRGAVALDLETAPGTLVRGNETLLARLAENLLRNAVVHNLPEGGWVRVRVARTGEWVALEVANSGEAVPADLVDRLAEPFLRASGRVRDGEYAGAGLGLALVSSITGAHGGRLDLHGLADGGLAVVVWLPAG